MFKIALQLYSLREQCEADLDGTLRKIKAAGYNGVETHTIYGLPAHELKAKLDAAGLLCPSMHVGLDMQQNDLDNVIACAITLGAKFLAIPWSSFENGEDALNLAEFVRKNADKVSKSGLTWLYHNHDHEFKPIENGRDFFALFLDNTDKAQINLQVDTYWVEKGGSSVKAFIERVKPRIGGFHLKDHREVGAGGIDFAHVLKVAAELSHEWVVVEQEEFDIEPFESIRISADYVRRLL